MTLPEGFRVKPKPSTSRPLTTRAPTFFNSFADAKAREKAKQKDEGRASKQSAEVKRRPPPAFYLDPGLKRSSGSSQKGGLSKPSSSKAAPKLSVLKPPAIGFEIAAAQAKLNARRTSGLATVVLAKQPDPLFTPGAGPSNAGASSSQRESSSAVFKPRPFPQFTLPSTKPAVDLKKMRKMVTPSTTPFALAYNTEAGAKALAAIVAEDRAKRAPPSVAPWSPLKRDAKGRLKLVRGGLAERVYAYFRSSTTHMRLWQHEHNRNAEQWKEYRKGRQKTKPCPVERHHAEFRIVKIVKLPLQPMYGPGSPDNPFPKPLSANAPVHRRRSALRRAKDKPGPNALPPRAIALCEIISQGRPTEQLVPVFFTWPKVNHIQMFKGTDKGWEEGAIVKVWKAKKAFIMKKGETRRIVESKKQTRGAGRRARGEREAGTSMDVDRPVSKKRRLEASDDLLDFDCINPLRYRQAKRAKLDEGRESKPTPLSIKELKRLPISEQTVLVRRFVLVPKEEVCRDGESSHIRRGSAPR